MGNSGAAKKTAVGEAPDRRPRDGKHHGGGGARKRLALGLGNGRRAKGDSMLILGTRDVCQSRILLLLDAVITAIRCVQIELQPVGRREWYASESAVARQNPRVDSSSLPGPGLQNTEYRDVAIRLL